MDQCVRCLFFDTIVSVRAAVGAERGPSSTKAALRLVAKGEKKPIKPALFTPLGVKDGRRKAKKIKTGYPNFDKLLDGGLVRGTVILLGGEPGAGKSTLVRQIVRHIGKESVPVANPATAPTSDSVAPTSASLGDGGPAGGGGSAVPAPVPTGRRIMRYATAEEQQDRIESALLRMELPLDKFEMANTDDIEAVLAAEPSPGLLFLVVDSLQKFAPNEIDAQIVVDLISKYTRKHNLITFVIVRLNKKGGTSGRTDIEYDGDCTMFIRNAAEDDDDPRRVVHVTKNRDGHAPFAIEAWMTSSGLVFEDPKAAPKRKGWRARIAKARSESQDVAASSHGAAGLDSSVDDQVDASVSGEE